VCSDRRTYKHLKEVNEHDRRRLLWLKRAADDHDDNSRRDLPVTGLSKKQVDEKVASEMGTEAKYGHAVSALAEAKRQNPIHSVVACKAIRRQKDKAVSMTRNPRTSRLASSHGEITEGDDVNPEGFAELRRRFNSQHTKKRVDVSNRELNARPNLDGGGVEQLLDTEFRFAMAAHNSEEIAFELVSTLLLFLMLRTIRAFKRETLRRLVPDHDLERGGDIDKATDDVVCLINMRAIFRGGTPYHFSHGSALPAVLAYEYSGPDRVTLTHRDSGDPKLMHQAVLWKNLDPALEWAWIRRYVKPDGEVVATIFAEPVFNHALSAEEPSPQIAPVEVEADPPDPIYPAPPTTPRNELPTYVSGPGPFHELEGTGSFEMPEIEVDFTIPPAVSRLSRFAATMSRLYSCFSLEDGGLPGWFRRPARVVVMPTPTPPVPAPTPTPEEQVEELIVPDSRVGPLTLSQARSELVGEKKPVALDPLAMPHTDAPPKITVWFSTTRQLCDEGTYGSSKVHTMHSLPVAFQHLDARGVKHLVDKGRLSVESTGGIRRWLATCFTHSYNRMRHSKMAYIMRYVMKRGFDGYIGAASVLLIAGAVLGTYSTHNYVMTMTKGLRTDAYYWVMRRMAYLKTAKKLEASFTCTGLEFREIGPITLQQYLLEVDLNPTREGYIAALEAKQAYDASIQQQEYQRISDRLEYLRDEGTKRAKDGFHAVMRGILPWGWLFGYEYKSLTIEKFAEISRHCPRPKP